MSKFFSHLFLLHYHWGKLHFGKKSDLLEVLVHDVHGEHPNFIDARLLDGVAVVHLLPAVNVSTDLFNKVLCCDRYMCRWLACIIT